MGLLLMGDLDNIPPFMRRYEEMVLQQKQSRDNRKFEDTSTYLGAPIRKGLYFTGILYDMRPAPDYVPIWELEHIAKKEFKCTFNLPCLERIESELGDVRRHGTFMNCHEIVYFPMLYGRHPFTSELNKYLWRCRSCHAKPDMVYLAQFKKCFMSALHKFQASHKKITINNLMLNDSLYCLNWFDHQSKQHIIRTLTSCLREQKHVIWLSAENTLLPLDDGLRLLLAFAIACGLSLKTLHLWHFFSEGALPIIIQKCELLLDDPHIFYKTEIDDKMINYMLFSIVMRSNYCIPLIMKPLVLNVAYYCFEYLEVFSVEYRYLAGDQGESLLYLGCIKNSTLRELNILYTHNDYYENTKRYVCHNAWKKAYRLCPCLRINFVAPLVKSFNSVVPVLVMCMPVEGFYTSTRFKTDDALNMVDLVAAALINNFKKFLKKINLCLRHPLAPVDHVISRLLTDLPFLEEFIYRGPMENISTLHNILKYIQDNSLRLKKFELYLAEDPCNPEPYSKAMSEIYNQYEPVFINKGIYFKLGTCQY